MSYFSWPQRCATGGAAQGLPQAAKALPALHFCHNLCGPSNPRQPGIRSVPCPESGNINHNSREKQQFTALSAETKILIYFFIYLRNKTSLAAFFLVMVVVIKIII
jgi:hypothetical protein